MIKVYNTLGGKKDVLKPRKGRKLNIFVCGPTVYDSSHIGHARTYIAFDIIVKFLRDEGYKVFYLQNITDIDDKIIKKAAEKQLSTEALAKHFEKDYLESMKKLKVISVSKYARATEHIKEIISQVERLIKKGFAYETSDGIYYDISKFKEYGKLSKRTALQAEDSVSRIDDGIEKKNKGDFCLWKKSPKQSSLRSDATGQAKPIKEPSWTSPWGPGRPGWHIEDTAITEKYFGSQYDIHGGGRDLLFPHHEAEIAQMEAISGKKPLVRYWLHTGFLTVNGEKMSKSLDNFITIQDFLNKPDFGNSQEAARALRLLFLKSHYRSPIDYSEKTISQIKNELARIDEFIDKVKNQKSSVRQAQDDAELVEASKIKNKKTNIKKLVINTKKEFKKAMEDDFNTPVALAAIFKLINEGNALIAEKKLSSVDSKTIILLLKKVDAVFDFIFWRKPKTDISQDIVKMVRKREGYRKDKNWQAADDIRKKIEEMGYLVNDTPEGSKIKKI